jgi:hypothetical protein
MVLLILVCWGDFTRKRYSYSSHVVTALSDLREIEILGDVRRKVLLVQKPLGHDINLGGEFTLSKTSIGEILLKLCILRNCSIFNNYL